MFLGTPIPQNINTWGGGGAGFREVETLSTWEVLSISLRHLEGELASGHPRSWHLKAISVLWPHIFEHMNTTDPKHRLNPIDLPLRKCGESSKLILLILVIIAAAVFFFFFWPHHVTWGTLVPWARIELCPLPWEYRVLTTGPLAKPYCCCNWLSAVISFKPLKNATQGYTEAQRGSVIRPS